MRLNDEQAIGLLPIGCDLRQEFVGRHASGSREIQLFAYLLTNHLRDARRCWKLHLVLGHVEIGFIERQRFDEVRMPLKNCSHSRRSGFVTHEIRRNEDRFRA